jgi:hypothetical protein
MLMGPDGRLDFTRGTGEVTGLFRSAPIPKGNIIGPLCELLLN